jgi:hypothetical protein
MTRQTILIPILLLIIFALTPGSNKQASAARSEKAKMNFTIDMSQEAPAEPVPDGPSGFPQTGQKPLAHKIHLQRIDELGKIHRFHKERVKKVRKHRGKYWMAVLIIIVSCHLALLVHAFLHLTH